MFHVESAGSKMKIAEAWGKCPFLNQKHFRFATPEMKKMLLCPSYCALARLRKRITVSPITMPLQ